MTLGMIGRALAVWLGILALAIANGALRESVLAPMLGRQPALLASGILLSVVILAVAYGSLPWLGAASVANCIGVGLGWLGLTLAFELTFGHLVQGRPWADLLDAYTFRDGNLWPVVLLVTAVAPCVAARIRGWA